MSMAAETGGQIANRAVTNGDVYADGASPKDYFDLLKPRVMSLVIFTALVGILVAPGQLHPVMAAVALLCIATGAGAAGALNMWYDADIDAVMKRTAKRPVPAGRVEPAEALSMGLFLSGVSIIMLGLWINWLAAGLLAFTIFFYAIIYTAWLKRATPQNIVIGGAAGAFPPMIGWACVTGSVSVESVVLFMIIFLWTPPHFWALSLFAAKDYAAAGVPMLPVAQGEKTTRNQIVIYSVLLAISAIMPPLMGFAGVLYAVIGGGLSAWFVWRAIDVWRQRGAENMRAEKRLFKFSIFYLAAIFGLLLIEKVAGLPVIAPLIAV